MRGLRKRTKQERNLSFFLSYFLLQNRLTLLGCWRRVRVAPERDGKSAHRIQKNLLTSDRRDKEIADCSFINMEQASVPTRRCC